MTMGLVIADGGTAMRGENPVVSCRSRGYLRKNRYDFLRRNSISRRTTHNRINFYISAGNDNHRV